jgi:hypothetical protein
MYISINQCELLRRHCPDQKERFIEVYHNEEDGRVYFEGEPAKDDLGTFRQALEADDCESNAEDIIEWAKKDGIAVRINGNEYGWDVLGPIYDEVMAD